VRRAVGLGDHKGLTDGTIMGGGQKRESSILTVDIDRIGIKYLYTAITNKEIHNGL
jgi:hypothetical protein